MFCWLVITSSFLSFCKVLYNTLKMKFISIYLNKTKSYSPVRFVIELFFTSKVLTFLMAGCLIMGTLIYHHGHINSTPFHQFPAHTSLIMKFLSACILTPMIETIIFQWLFLTLLSKITSYTPLIIGVDGLLFALAHWPEYGFFKASLILPAGLILAWSFYVNNKDSFLKAFGITASIHALSNLSILLLLAF